MHNLVLTPVHPDTLIEETAKEVFKLIEKRFGKQSAAQLPPKYISADELAKRLDIDKSTIHNWRKRGLIKAYQIGHRVYYRWDEVEAGMIPLKK